ncbi:MAG: hypothetical protein ACLFNU_10020 [Bacteroidales bacterium]
MKKIVLGLILLFSSLIIQAQIRVDALVGGSNYLGASINVTKGFELFSNENQYIDMTIGLGHVLEYYNPKTMLIHFRLNYKIKKIGFSVETSRFIENYIKDNELSSDMVDLILYPNINYTFFTNRKFYLNISAGAYFAFDKFSMPSAKSEWSFAGDVVPGAGLRVGYTFR